MTIRHLASWVIGIAVFGAATWSPFARSAGQGRALNHLEPLVLKEGGRVEFCSEGAGCRMGKHPDAVGLVRQIVPGAFISAASASWIALSDRLVNLCYLAASSASVTCTPIANGAELTKGTQIEYQDLDDGTRTLRFSPKQGDRATGKASFNPYPFMVGVGEAADVLQKHAARQRSGNATYANASIGGRDGADVCEFVIGGGVICTSGGDEEVYDGGGRVAASAAMPAQQRLADPNAIATVQTGRSDRPTPQRCTNSANAQMSQCNDPRNNLGYEAHQACMADAESDLRECKAEVRYNANLNR